MGHASPVVWKDRLFLISAVGPEKPELLLGKRGGSDIAGDMTPHSWRIFCVDAREGTIRWEMEVYSGIIGREAAVSFLRWCAEHQERPVSAREVLEEWEAVSHRVAAQRDDLQAVTMNEVITAIEVEPELHPEQEGNLIAYLSVLPRDQRFGLVKALVRIPAVAQILCKDQYDEVVYEAISAISAEAEGRRAGDKA